MTRILIYAILLVLVAPLQAQHQACLVQIEKFEDVNKISCTEEDYVTLWNNSQSDKSFLAINAAMMHICDLSRPYQVQSGGAGGYAHSATCTMRRIRVPVVADDEKSKAGIE